MAAMTRSERFAVQDMLWDKAGLEPVEQVPGNRGLALALTSCGVLIGRLNRAMELAGLTLVTIEDVERCIRAVASQKPDVVFLDERITAGSPEFRRKLRQARVTETLPILPILLKETLSVSIGSKSPESEIFMKTRALLRRERPFALRGKRHSGAFVLDESRFKLYFADRVADLNKTELCLLGPFFDMVDVVLGRQTLEQLALPEGGRKVGSRTVDFQVSRMRRRVKAQLGVDPFRAVRGIGYALARV
ncbi:hypothetical protein M8756_14750 [Lutimaribacter sp. EGI FJ00015]|uniref:Uncharacterized protein n=1 Tax=Lutimaribacter degradans TaxID=2945989 RepID=A0ACC5ZZU2_9RHOB|nr:winged helix-turn-helix domain-containing protein [Lutimaribacter sp. EGI FJ00013]MCM2563345.1 hypothetical protein [Lutimaribacter sp. EGI FJ00013]MCO0614577.1 hypothetical protein [Lutimaribacter sp. EGI FJ00015]MCO0637249.1 hypothetical protein [Lutimaribacter sp. EGI FJ00014]